MAYVAIELVTKQDDTFTVSTYKKGTRDEAEKAYHSILAVAATSGDKVHSAVIMNPEGAVLKSENYKHELPAPTPEPEEEQKEGEE